jgi:hypothetical protein
MHTIKLDIQSYTSAGVAHTNLIINGDDSGVLYLSRNELETLNRVLTTGSQGHDDVMYSQVELEDEEFEYDVFED